MSDEKLSELLDKLLETSLKFLKENGYNNVDRIMFGADGLKEGMRFPNSPCIDNCVSIYDEKGKKLGEYM